MLDTVTGVSSHWAATTTPTDLAYRSDMCRSIKTLRPPFIDAATEADVQAAALQYVRKVSGFRAPAAHNREAFDHAVSEVSAATATLLAALEVRGQR